METLQDKSFQTNEIRWQQVAPIQDHDTQCSLHDLRATNNDLFHRVQKLFDQTFCVPDVFRHTPLQYAQTTVICLTSGDINDYYCRNYYL